MSKPWTATYRLQLHRDFPLTAAAEILPYLKRLGISHLYLPPCLQAVPGSTHGYDGTDPGRIADDIGGEEGWKTFCAATRSHGLGILMDIVPNHMAVSTGNPWWEDLLLHGPYSRFAGFFDIFDAAGESGWTLHLAPLAAAPEELIRDGRFEIEWSNTIPRLICGDLSWPLGIQAGDLLLAEPMKGSREIFRELAALRRNPAPGPEELERWRELCGRGWEMLRRNAARIRRHLTAPELSAVMDLQFYRLHHWKDAPEHQNFRRFFDVNTLTGLRMEDPAVFEACHARIRECIRNGEIDGLRVDHPDGLLDPLGYLQRLRDLFPGGRIYVEKILTGEEKLPEEWPVDGTVGYEFLIRLNRLWMDENHAGELSALHASFTGEERNYESLVPEKKRQVMELLFRRELDHLADLGLRMAREETDFPPPDRRYLRAAVAALSVELAVYRTYKRGDELPGRDAEILAATLAKARAHLPETGAGIFDLLERVLFGKNGPLGREWVARWQQFTGPVAAKGVEDTAFYNFSRLISANEVGGDPGIPGISAESFHEFCVHLLAKWPENLLSTSTHDTKRSEDARARISVLSGQPARWARAVEQWSAMNAAGWRAMPPDRHMEYYLYQTLAGAWPLDETRCQDHMLKACREAKRHTSWLAPDAAYEKGVREFIGHLYQSREFIRSLEEFLEPLIPAGHASTLAQTLVKLTAPGIPDIYQGCELPEFSLVDPDNRRPVDFDARRRMLDELERNPAAPAWRAPEAKLWIIARTLAVRRTHPEDFGPAGSYTPLMAGGARLRHVLAFRRGSNFVIAVPRFLSSMGGNWQDTALPLPEGTWTDVFSGRTFQTEARAHDLFSSFPAALLQRHSIS